MARTKDLNEDLGIGMNEIRDTLKHYKLDKWREYLIVRRRGQPESYVILAHPSDKSDFADKLLALHKAEARIEHVHNFRRVQWADTELYCQCGETTPTL